jgi:chaperonin cofactor prefoldin
LLEFRRELTQLNAKIQSRQRTQRRAEVSIEELAEINDSTRTYITVSRMFMQVPISTIRAELDKEAKVAGEELKKLLVSHFYLSINQLIKLNFDLILYFKG